MGISSHYACLSPVYWGTDVRFGEPDAQNPDVRGRNNDDVSTEVRVSEDVRSCAATDDGQIVCPFSVALVFDASLICMK